MRAAWQILFSWLFTLLFALSFSLAMLLTLGLVWRRMSPALLAFWGRTMLRIAGVRIEVEGREHLATDSMKVATFNHGSMLDAFLIPAVMPPGSTAAIKREVIFYPVVGLAVWLAGFLIIDRGNNDRARRTMARAAERMARERITVFISPEGTRSPTAELLPFKKGAFHLALATGAPIVPVVVEGASELHPRGSFTSTPGLVRIRALPPRSSAAFRPETLGAEAEALRAVYTEELARMKAERAGRRV